MNNLAEQQGFSELTQTYFTQFITAGGPIVWFILLPMSFISLYLLTDLSLTIRRKKLIPVGICSEIITAASRYGKSSIVSRFGRNTDLISRAICAVYSRIQKMNPTQSLTSQIAAESLQEQGMRLMRRVEWCNLLGNVAPMVGLFGTVWGMIEAFTILGITSGQPKPGQLAASISVALVTTFWGLLVAIPSLFIYGLFRSRVEVLVSEAAIETETLLERIAEIPTHSVFHDLPRNEGGTPPLTSASSHKDIPATETKVDIQKSAGFVSQQRNTGNDDKPKVSQNKK